jgi:hypothetical protein
MKRLKHMVLMEKSVAACVSAIEIYNKPDFQHREETFSVLMGSAWELMLKARILKDNKNQLRSIYVMDPLKTKTGKPTKRKTPRLNGSKNATTIPIKKAIEMVLSYPSKPLDKACAENIRMLLEIRDNSVHFMNSDTGLALRVQEIGTASLKNYLTAARDWFGYDLTKYNFYLMPLSFFHEADVKSFSIEKRSEQVKNLFTYLSEAEKAHPSDEGAPFNVTLRIETKFVKASSKDAMDVQITKDPNATKIIVTEASIRDKYPLDYKQLVGRLRLRYNDFTANKKFNDAMKDLKKSERFAKAQLLDPEKPHGSSKMFYSTEIFKEFDMLYTKHGGPAVTMAAE